MNNGRDLVVIKDPNWNKDPDVIAYIIQMVGKSIKLNKSDIQMLMRQIIRCDTERFKKYPQKDVMDMFAEIFIESFKKQRGNKVGSENKESFSGELVVDKSDKLYTNMFDDYTYEIKSIYKMLTMKQIAAFYRFKSGLSREYIVLDSKYQDDSLTYPDNYSKQRWKYVNWQSSTSTLTTNKKIGNIVGIKMSNAIFQTFQGFNKKTRYISFLIEEMRAQSYKSANREYHFMGFLENYVSSDYKYNSPSSSGGDFDYYKYGNFLARVENHHEGTFVFNKPIQTLDTITVSYGDPIDPVVITTIFQAQLVSGTVHFNGVDYTMLVFQTDVPHGMPITDDTHFYDTGISALYKVFLDYVDWVWKGTADPLFITGIPETLYVDEQRATFVINETQFVPGFLIDYLNGGAYGTLLANWNTTTAFANRYFKMQPSEFISQRIIMPMEITFIEDINENII